MRLKLRPACLGFELHRISDLECKSCFGGLVVRASACGFLSEVAQSQQVEARATKLEIRIYFGRLAGLRTTARSF